MTKIVKEHCMSLHNHYNQNGVCDFKCSSSFCNADGRDCNQLRFVDKYSNCTFDLFMNICKECNNSYCAAYAYQSISNNILYLDNNIIVLQIQMYLHFRKRWCSGEGSTFHVDIWAFKTAGRKSLKK